MDSVSYLIAAVGSAAIAVNKWRPLLAAPWEGRRTVLPLWAGAICVSLAFICIAPITGTALDRWTGVNNLSMLLTYCLAIGMVCGGEVLVVNWRHPWRTARLRTILLVVTSGLVIAVMCALFILAPKPIAEHQRDFPAAYAGTPWLGGLLVIYFAAFSLGLLGVIYQGWRAARETPPDKSWLRCGIHLITIGFLFPFTFGIISLVVVTADWFGGNLSYGRAEVALKITPIGVFVFLIGISIAVWGHRITSTRQRLHGYLMDVRDYRQLAPLWRALRPIDPTMVHAAERLVDRVSPEFRLWWRVVEINDWLERLHDFRDPKIASDILLRCDNQAGVVSDHLMAMVDAAQVDRALRARASGERPRTAEPVESHPAPPAQHAFASERRRLVLVAQAYAGQFATDTDHQG